MCLFLLIFFFCRQKTAYELLISDWSSAFALPICPACAVHRAHGSARQCVDQPGISQRRSLGGILPCLAVGTGQWLAQNLLLSGLHQGYRRPAARIRPACAKRRLAGASCFAHRAAAPRRPARRTDTSLRSEEHT